MSTAAEIQLRAEGAAGLLAAMERGWREWVAEPTARYIIAHPSLYRSLAEARGCPIGRHARARGMRASKRAFHRSYRPAFTGVRIVIKSKDLPPWA